MGTATGAVGGAALGAITGGVIGMIQDARDRKEQIFDLARYESSKADGSAEAVRYRGNSVPVLAKEWTYDGGHLNEVGRRRVAEAFLAQLADAYGRGASAP